MSASRRGFPRKRWLKKIDEVDIDTSTGETTLDEPLASGDVATRDEPGVGEPVHELKVDEDEIFVRRRQAKGLVVSLDVQACEINAFFERGVDLRGTLLVPDPASGAGVHVGDDGLGESEQVENIDLGAVLLSVESNLSNASGSNANLCIELAAELRHAMASFRPHVRIRRAPPVEVGVFQIVRFDLVRYAVELGIVIRVQCILERPLIKEKCREQRHHSHASRAHGPG